MRAGGTIGSLILAAALAGCATRADLLEQDRKISAMMEEQTRAMDAMRRELERLRQDMAPRPAAPRGPGSRAPAKSREKVVETAPPVAPSPGEIGMTLAPDGVSAEAGVAPQAGTPGAGSAPSPGVVAAAPPPAPAPTDEDWRREVAQERAVATATAAPERAEYLRALEAAQRGDCAPLKALSGGLQGSSLGDNAVYWQARCLAARGDRKKAAARLDDVVTRYPKSDKAPAALWEQGQLQLRAGDTAAARATLARLVRDYPASAEAGRARGKLAELTNQEP